MDFEFPAEFRGRLVRLRALRADDYEPLRAAASDPLIWEQHSEPRHLAKCFDSYFRQLMTGGAYLVLDASGHQVLGCKSFIDFDPAADEVELGSTFLARRCWGKGHNREANALLLQHAERYARWAVFLVADHNQRSQRALAKLGAEPAGRRPNGDGDPCAVFRLPTHAWRRLGFDLQPVRRGQRVQIQPLRPDDHDALFAAAGDPLIWEQHPAARWKPEVFRGFFQEALDNGALLVLDAATGEVIGTSRYHHLDSAASQVEIGYTFLKRSHWGGRYNSELKAIMLRHAFQWVDTVRFVVAPQNFRSQRAVEKIGGVRAGTVPRPGGQSHVLFHLTKEAFSRRADFMSAP